MISVKDLVLGDVASELDNTRKLLEAVPDEHFDWKPHENRDEFEAAAAAITDEGLPGSGAPIRLWQVGRNRERMSR